MPIIDTTNPNLETFYGYLNGKNGIMISVEAANEAEARQKIATEPVGPLGKHAKEEWEASGAELHSATLDALDAAIQEIMALDARKTELEAEIIRLRDRCVKFGLIEQ